MKKLVVISEEELMDIYSLLNRVKAGEDKSEDMAVCYQKVGNIADNISQQMEPRTLQAAQKHVADLFNGLEEGEKPLLCLLYPLIMDYTPEKDIDLLDPDYKELFKKSGMKAMENRFKRAIGKAKNGDSSEIEGFLGELFGKD